MGRVTEEQRRPRVIPESSSGVWCDDTQSGPGGAAGSPRIRLVCLDAQHGGYSRTEIIDTARSFPSGLGELVVRVASCDFAAIGAPRWMQGPRP